MIMRMVKVGFVALALIVLSLTGFGWMATHQVTPPPSAHRTAVW